MNGKKVEKIYRNHAENIAPDMDALWERIERGLEEKSEMGITSRPVHRKISITKITALTAACIAALIIAPVVINNIDKAAMSTENVTFEAVSDEAVHENDKSFVDKEESSTSFEEFSDEVFDFKNNVEAEEVNDEAYVSETKTVYYDRLALAPTSNQNLMPEISTSGDDFFVEERILIETDVIVSAYIDNVYSSGNGAICYEITANNVETGKKESIYLESATPYVMQENRSYILPLKKDSGEYSLTFENAPQIELTLDDGMIFHNGWETLDNDSFDVIYPQGSTDDYFYDRMKFSYTADLSALLQKWHELQIK